MLGFTLVADTYRPEQDKRWVLVAPPGAGEGAATILLARASWPEQEKFIGNLAGGLSPLVTPDLIRGPPSFFQREERVDAGSSPA